MSSQLSPLSHDSSSSPSPSFALAEASIVLRTSRREICLFRDHVINSNKLRDTLVKLMRRVPSANKELVDVCKSINLKLNDLLSIRADQLSLVLSVVRDVLQQLSVMLKTPAESVGGKFPWLVINKAFRKLEKVKFDPLTIIRFSNNTETPMQEIFVQETQSLLSYTGVDAIKSELEKMQTLKEKRLAALAKTVSLGEEINTAEETIKILEDAKLRYEEKVNSAKADTDEDKKDKLVLVELREKVRAINLQMKQTYKQPIPVCFFGIELFMRYETVTGNDPELKAQKVHLQATIDEIIAQYNHRHEYAEIYQSEIDRINHRISEQRFLISQKKHKLQQPNSEIASIEADIAKQEKIIEHLERDSKEPLSLMQDISESALTLQVLLTTTKTQAIDVYNTVYHETERLLGGVLTFANDLDVEEKRRSIPYLESLFHDLTLCHDLLCILQFKDV